ncbi:MAG TPA: ATP-binding protein [Kofleriaceae bacterium]|nr:ATP-binding protein [Kofleriaceae bacterium]
MSVDRDEVANLERTSRRLDAACAIIQAVHEELTIEGVLNGIVVNLVEVAGFAGAEIAIDAHIDDLRVVHSTSAGSKGESSELTRECAVFLRGNEVGQLITRYRTEELLEEQSDLLEFLLPTMYMGLEHAVSFAEVEDYRKSLEQKVIERTAQLNEAHEALKEAKASRDRFFANINHEIRTPLTLIQLSTDGIARSNEKLSKGTREKLESVNASTRRLLHLVNSLLLLAAGDEGKLRIRPRPIDVAAILQKLVANWQPAAQVGEIQLSYAGPETCDATMDEAAIETIAGNFVSNATKFTPRGGRITVTLVAAEETVTISVRDTGPGIDPELVPRLFGRFERAQSAVARGVRGTGIGLSLSKELVEQQGGAIDVRRESDPTGTTFEVTLARRQTVEAIAVVPALPLPEQDYTAAQLDEKDTRTHAVTSLDTVDLPEARAEATHEPEATILLAEDDPALQRNIADLLATRYRVLTASNGRIALEMAAEHLPDLLVTDLEMPEMNGVELTKRFLQLKGTGMSPVLIVSAHAGLGTRLAGFEAGAVDYIVKPFAADELLARVRNQLAIRQLAYKLHESQKLASLGMLSAGLAHEIRNPANALVNALRPLLELLPPEEQAPESTGALLAEVALDAANQIRQRCMNILDYSRSDDVTRRPEHIDKLIGRACRLLTDSLKSVELRQEVNVTTPVPCAGPLIEQILINLLDNAAYAAGVGGWVRVAGRQDAKRVIIEIGDSGPGVPAHIQDRIFEPFFTTKPAGKGTGLGLAISRRIALNHGGDLRVVRLDQGTAFRLELPLE